MGLPVGGKGWQVLACGTTGDEWDYQWEGGLAGFSLWINRR